MITYCSKCRINWAQLHSQDADGDETYDYCPLCRSSEFLGEGTDLTAYIMNPFTGEITDADSGDLLLRKPRFRVSLQPANSPVLGAGDDMTREELQDAAIEAYQTHGVSAYFNSFKQHKK